MSKLRVGLIGVGGIMNGTHIPGYLTCDDCEIVAICDINPETLKKVGEKLNIPEEKRFLHHEDLMAGGKLVLKMGDRPNKSWGTK